MCYSHYLPPDTGASMKTAPIFSTSLANSFETEGSIVLESINSEPFFTFLSKSTKMVLKTIALWLQINSTTLNKDHTIT